MKRTRRTTIAPDPATRRDLRALSEEHGDMAVALTVDTWEPRRLIPSQDDSGALWLAALTVVKAMRDRAAVAGSPGAATDPRSATGPRAASKPVVVGRAT